MAQLIISNLSGYTLPVNLYGCDAYGNQCILISVITTPIPPQITINLPAIFDTYPSLTVKVTNDINCDTSRYLICKPDKKEFQDGIVFYFMDGEPYDFQNI